MNRLAVIAYLPVLSIAAAAAAAVAAAVVTTSPSAPRIPLCAGLTVVTAIDQAEGDYESIKRIESVSATGVRLKYSSEALVKDEFSDDPPAMVHTTVYRTVRTQDLAAARIWHRCPHARGK